MQHSHRLPVSPDPLPPRFLSCLAGFADLFTRPTWPHVLVLIAGVILAPSRRTVTSALRILGRERDPDFCTFHRILNRAAWSSRVVAGRLLVLLIAAFVPTGAPVVIGLDDTIERRWGPKISARGIYRDPVRSSKGHFVKASGLRWLSAMLLVRVPWADRIMALPFLTLLAPSKRFYTGKSRAPKTLLDWARQAALQIHRWLPDRYIVLVAGRHEGRNQQDQQSARHDARRPRGAIEDTMEGTEVGIALAPEDAQRRRDGAPAGCQNDPGDQHQHVRPGWAREQIGESREAGEKAWRERIGRDRQAMGVLHPIRRINRLNRSNSLAVRQIESAISSILAKAPVIGHIDRYDQTRSDACPDRRPVHPSRRGKERQRLHHRRPPHLKLGGTAASHSRHRSLRAILLVKCHRSLDYLRKPRSYETHARERSRNRRERTDIPHPSRLMKPVHFLAKVKLSACMKFLR